MSDTGKLLSADELARMARSELYDHITALTKDRDEWVLQCGRDTRLIIQLTKRAEAAERELARFQWQPIETAPKDGTVILLHVGETYMCGYWMNGWGDFGWLPLPQSGLPFVEPTHWMPLPSPPKE